MTRAPDLENTLFVVFLFLHSQILTVSSRMLYNNFLEFKKNIPNLKKDN